MGLHAGKDLAEDYSTSTRFQNQLRIDAVYCRSVWLLSLTSMHPPESDGRLKSFSVSMPCRSGWCRKRLSPCTKYWTTISLWAVNASSWPSKIRSSFTSTQLRNHYLHGLAAFELNARPQQSRSHKCKSTEIIYGLHVNSSMRAIFFCYNGKVGEQWCHTESRMRSAFITNHIYNCSFYCVNNAR